MVGLSFQRDSPIFLLTLPSQTASEQLALLREPKSVQIVEKVRDETSSLRASSIRGSIARTSSVFSQGNHTIGSTEFEMDNGLVTQKYTGVLLYISAHGVLTNEEPVPRTVLTRIL
jgi:hypothetical protein